MASAQPLEVSIRLKGSDTFAAQLESARAAVKRLNRTSRDASREIARLASICDELGIDFDVQSNNDGKE